MIKPDEIANAMRGVWEIFNDVGEASDFLDFAMTMLLWKYLSDSRGLDPHNRTEEHYVVPPAAHFSTVFVSKNQTGNGERIDAALRMLEKHNVGLEGLFSGISFKSVKLGNVEQKEHVLRRLLEAFNTSALDFRGDPCTAAEAASYACDVLLWRLSELRGRKIGEPSTPPEICRLIARLMQPKETDEISDPCCGSGSLLISCGQFARQNSGMVTYKLFGQEKNGSTWALCKMNMILHGEARSELIWGDTLRDPAFVADDGSLRRFDVVVSNPPISLKEWGQEVAERDRYQRFRRGVPPRTSSDYAFISHMVESLKPGSGRMAAIVSLGVLFRSGAEQQIRKKLLEENLIDAVVVLPAKMFTHTGIPFAILIIRHSRADQDILFIDASRSFQHGKTHNVLRAEDSDRICNSYIQRKDIDGYVRKVGRAEILENDCNLTVARYVSALEGMEEELDLTAIRAERAQLQTELLRLEEKLVSLREWSGFT